MRAFFILAASSLLLVLGCGDDGGGSGLDGSMGGGDGSVSGDGGNVTGDGGNVTGDGGNTGECTPGGTECTDCVDNDGDGFIDGNDLECVSAADDDEGSFATGISGDNMAPHRQDCFFDGNTGSGDDGCNIPTCCLTDECPEDPDCALTQECIDKCGSSTPPGCDCFGCCTICDDQGCEDILINEAVAPDCTEEVIHDPALCPTCTKDPECSTDCDTENCILCPGQTEDDLPEECSGNECPNNQTVCEGDADCGSTEYCNNGCCIQQIE